MLAKKKYLPIRTLEFLIFKSTSVFGALHQLETGGNYTTIILFWILHHICNMYLGISFLNLFEDNIYSSAYEIAATKSIEADLLSFFL